MANYWFKRCSFFALCLALDVAHAEFEQTFSARAKWFGTLTAVPDRSVQRVLDQVDTPLFDQNLDLRLMWSAQQGAFRLIAEHSTTVLQGDSVSGFSAQSELNQIIDNDDARVADLTWQLNDGARHSAWHRFDRLAVQYQQGAWSATVGRQAVSWGNGMVFQPLDLFNPFTPTAVDKDYKPGNDLMLLERVMDDGSDLQLLAVGRRDADAEITGQVGSVALKWRSAIGDSEYEIMLGRHYADQVYGVSWRRPLAGALLRTDIVASRLRDARTTKVSAIVNVDYSFSVAQRTTYVFAEYYHNGFGQSGKTPALSELDSDLVQRLQRGEVFAVQRNYLALGVSYQWHPLWTQSLTTISNLHDSSTVVTTQLVYEPGDHQRLEMGLLTNIGGAGDEYSGLFAEPKNSGLLVDESGRALTTGGNTQFFVRWAYYL